MKKTFGKIENKICDVPHYGNNIQMLTYTSMHLCVIVIVVRNITYFASLSLLVILSDEGAA